MIKEEAYENFIWWQGVVEDRNDPLKLGRCRVRILGYHTDNISLIPTDKLPWATPCQPITSAAMNGIGISPLGPVEGTWVFGFFRDGRECQEPIIFGTIGGIPQQKSNPSIGFNDPNAVYPKEDHLKEPDTNRLARNENIDKTIVEVKKNNIDKSVNTASGDSWSEPITEYDAEYPKNKVFESESGHIIELDDTPSKERIHIYHKSGSFVEIFPDGSIVTKCEGSDYTIIQDDKNVHVKGQMNITIDNDCALYVKGDADIKVDGNVVETVGGNVTKTVKGNYKIKAKTFKVKANRIDLN